MNINNQKDILLEKIYNESNKQFSKCIDLLSDNKKYKIAFYSFLFNDLISESYLIEQNNNIRKLNSSQFKFIIDNQETVIYKYFIKIKNITDSANNKIQNNIIDNTYIKQIKEIKEKLLKENLLKKYKEVKKKIDTCNDKLYTLKNLYIKQNVEQSVLNFVESTEKTILLEDNILKSPLLKKDSIVLGEFFSRFLFVLVDIELYNKNGDLLNLFNNFYETQKMESYISLDKKNLINFSDIHMNFKYWIIYLLTISTLFTTNNYNILFNRDEFKKHISGLLSSKNYDKKIYMNLFNNCYIDNYNIMNLKKVYIEPFEKSMTYYFKYRLHEVYVNSLITSNYILNSSKKDYKKYSQETSAVVENIRIKHPFKNEKNKLNTLLIYKKNEKDKDKDKKKTNPMQQMQQMQKMQKNYIKKGGQGGLKRGKNPIELYDIKKLKQKLQKNKESKKEKNKKTSELKESQKYLKQNRINELTKQTKISIFDFLYTYSNNEKDISKFMYSIRKKIILLLFYLYTIKRKIYIEYNKQLKTIFEISNNSKNKKENKKENSKKNNIINNNYDE